MNSKVVKGFVVASGMLMFSVSAWAHHGAAAYDSDATMEVVGTVTRFDFVNPHVLISIAVTGEDGNVVEWSAELTSPNRLARSERSSVKWSKDILQLGDEITLIGNPASNGAPSLRLLEVVDPDGRGLLGSDYMSDRKN